MTRFERKKKDFKKFPYPINNGRCWNGTQWLPEDIKAEKELIKQGKSNLSSSQRKQIINM